MKQSVICLGAGVTGKSCDRFLSQRGFKTILTDDNSDRASVSMNEATQYLKQDLVSFVVTSPGILLTHPLLELARQKKIEILGDIELGLRFLEKKRPKLIAITGTNGKTTVTLLVEHMLRQARFQAYAVGNVGNAFLDSFEHHMKADALIIEISSQQLELTQTPAFDMGCITNITPNHLDWHGSMQSYVNAKKRLALHVGENPLFMKRGLRDAYFQDCSKNYYDENDIPIEGVCGPRLQQCAPHDRDNFIFAYGMAVEFGVDPQIAIDAYETFQKPPHRIQFVGEHNGVFYYDDSKGTSVAAVLCAVSSVPGPIQLIAGGVHKGEPYRDWIPLFLHRGVERVFAIGEAKEIMKRDLAPHIEVIFCSSLEEAIFCAREVAKEGGSVLLSPGCASWDMFQSYKDRGMKFQEYVKGFIHR